MSDYEQAAELLERIIFRKAPAAWFYLDDLRREFPDEDDAVIALALQAGERLEAVRYYQTPRGDWRYCVTMEARNRRKARLAQVYNVARLTHDRSKAVT